MNKQFKEQITYKAREFATAYTNRHLPNEPAFAFGHEGWAKFVVAMVELAGAHPDKDTSALPFPVRIMDQLQEIARREDSEHHGPWTDGDGEPLQDDADAAISWIKATSPQAALITSFGVPADRIALLLKNSMKPEEINGETRVQHSRVAEIISWMARYTEGNANGKWLVGHACELAYYIASNGVNQHIDMSAAMDKAFTNGVNISAEDRAMLNRINPDKFPPQAAPVAQLSDPLTWNQKMAGVKALLGCTDGELECIGEKNLDTYCEEVERVYRVLCAAPTTPKEAP